MTENDGSRTDKVAAEPKTSSTEKAGARKRHKTLTGTVLSDKMDKTVVVMVTRRYKHPVFSKYVSARKKYKAHDERNSCKTGDTVLIEESRPLSREKRWRVKSILKRNANAG